MRSFVSGIICGFAGTCCFLVLSCGGDKASAQVPPDVGASAIDLVRVNQLIDEAIIENSHGLTWFVNEKLQEIKVLVNTP